MSLRLHARWPIVIVILKYLVTDGLKEVDFKGADV